MSPPASSPSAGPTMIAPRSARVATAAWVAGCSHISVCMAGAMTVGTVRQVNAEVTMSSAMPAANFAIRLVVAGAKIATSARRATSTCTIRWTSVKVSV